MDNQNEKHMYDSANAYYRGATILMKQTTAADPSQHLVQPAVTCASLSLKLYLKCLLALEQKDREDSIYNIAELYQNLNDEKKKLILAKFDEFSNTQLSSEELLKHLSSLDNAFKKWRYIHEEDARSVNLEDLEEMILAAKATITMSKPDWE